MPSYRYLKDIDPNDLKPEAPKELSGKEKRQNWWHYHKAWVIAGALALAIVGYTVYEAVTQVYPDLEVALIAPYNLPAQLVTKLEDGLARLTEDLNGDGRVVARLSVYTVAVGEAAGAEPSGDPEVEMANAIKLAANIQTGETMLFIMDGAAADAYQQTYGIFGLADGNIAPEGTPAVELGLRFADAAGLADMDLMLEDSEGGSLDATEVVRDYLIGTRAYYDTALEGDSRQLENWEYARELLQTMETG